MRLLTRMDEHVMADLITSFERLTAHLTHMRLLTRVDDYVPGEVTPLIE